jgi:hypothetical protein
MTASFFFCWNSSLNTLGVCKVKQNISLWDSDANYLQTKSGRFLIEKRETYLSELRPLVFGWYFSFCVWVGGPLKIFMEQYLCMNY